MRPFSPHERNIIDMGLKRNPKMSYVSLGKLLDRKPQQVRDFVRGKRQMETNLADPLRLPLPGERVR